MKKKVLSIVRYVLSHLGDTDAETLMDSANMYA